ncbi:protein ADM2 [Corythoichthys intestinalis]|uniref:protein ADM2 n=1 Tax=Corythoichthys intestinalis TaxID=161448 RepID=UPI0025A53AC6|nr:protein ADM2 [Corythoichthys intestinalis]
MCALLPVWTCLLLGFLPLETQTRAVLSIQNLQGTRHRLSKRMMSSFFATVTSDYSVAITLAESRLIWRIIMKEEPRPRWSEMEWKARTGKRGQSRGRRHTNRRRAKAQLMRAGCVLGTCQVQNLSHRLYQLIGRSGREDSSPVNPRSPHSYG